MTSPAGPLPGITDGPAWFTAAYELSLAEQVRATRYVVNRQPGMWFVYSMVPLLAAADALGKWLVHGRWKPTGLTIVLVGLALLVFAGLHVEPIVRLRRYRRQHPQANGPVSLTLDAEGVAVSSGLGSGRLIWPMIPKVAANGEFLFVYLNKTTAQALPLRVLSREQVDSFWWVLGRHAPHLVRHSRAA